MKKMQAFLTMSFTIAVALAIGFFMQAQEEKGTRIKIEKMFGSALKEKEVLAIKLNKELREKERLISFISASLSKERLINSKLTENLGRSSKRFALVSVPKKPIELEKIIISSLLESEGKVLAVDKQNDLVVVNLGAMNNLKNGDRLSIYRGHSVIANAQVIKVQDRISAAMILPERNGKNIIVEINDMVK